MIYSDSKAIAYACSIVIHATVVKDIADRVCYSASVPTDAEIAHGHEEIIKLCKELSLAVTGLQSYLEATKEVSMAPALAGEVQV